MPEGKRTDEKGAQKAQVRKQPDGCNDEKDKRNVRNVKEVPAMNAAEVKIKNELAGMNYSQLSSYAADRALAVIKLQARIDENSDIMTDMARKYKVALRKIMKSLKATARRHWIRTPGCSAGSVISLMSSPG